MSPHDSACHKLEMLEDREARIASELEKFPRSVLLAMVLAFAETTTPITLPRECSLYIAGGNCASAADLARSLAPALARRDFLRRPGEG